VTLDHGVEDLSVLRLGRGALDVEEELFVAVVFTHNHQSEFDAIREQVENYVAERSAAPGSVARPDPAEEIRKFAQLRDEGIPSEDEFQAKKSEILGR
jgi:hypothetical protein